jgi:hypothetical protein
MRSIVKLVKNTHRHPANRALHMAGAPLYVAGLAMVVGYFAGIDTDPLAGLALWLSAVAMFTIGHKIEGNLGTITPVLLLRLLSKVVKDLFTDRVHLVRA